MDIPTIIIVLSALVRQIDIIANILVTLICMTNASSVQTDRGVGMNYISVTFVNRYIAMSVEIIISFLKRECQRDKGFLLY